MRIGAWIFAAAAAAPGLSAAARQDPAKEQLKTLLKDADIPAAWVYDDVNAGFAEARKSTKPMLVVFR